MRDERIATRLGRLHSVRIQLVALVAAIVLPLAAVSAWMAWQQYQAQRDVLGQTLISVARALAAAADRELATGLALGETLGHSQLIDERRFEAFYELSIKALAGRPGAWMVLFEPSGQMLLNTLRPYGAKMPNVFEQAARLPLTDEAGLPRGGADSVKIAFQTQRPVYSGLFEGQVSGKPVVGIAVPVIREGRAVYVLALALPASTFQPLVAAQPRLVGSGAVLFDQQGFIVARAVKPEEFVGRRVPRETLEALRGNDESFAAGTNVEGQAFFRAVVRSPVSGWGAGVAVNEQDTFGVIWRAMRQSALAAALILLGGLALALGLARSIARRREAEAQSQAKDRFIAALSHELRNPIAAIALATEVLKRSPRDERQAAEVVETLSRQVGQLRRLLDDLLDSSRALYGKLGLQLEAVELKACAARVARDYTLRPAFAARIDVAGDEVWVKADPARLAQMIDNLVENAVKYGARTVAIGAAHEGDWGVLKVTDDGQGISPQLMRRLFEPFVQGDQSLERAQGGLGLGLKLVKRLASLQGGAVAVQSAGEGRGSSFTLRLPAASPPAASAAPESRPQVGRRRVLVVEDNADARESLRRLLEAEGHEVAVAGDGGEALGLLASFRPQLALVDVGLPGMSGYELARAMRTARGETIVLVAMKG